MSDDVLKRARQALAKVGSTVYAGGTFELVLSGLGVDSQGVEALAAQPLGAAPLVARSMRSELSRDGRL